MAVRKTDVSARLARRAVIVPPDFDPIPSWRSARVELSAVTSVPADADAIAVPVGADGRGAEALGLDAAALAAVGFDGKPGQTHVVAGIGAPVEIAVGIGDPMSLDGAAIRDAAAAFALAAKRASRLAVRMPSLARPDVAAQAIVEGVLLARYAYEPLKSGPGSTRVESISLVTDSGRRKAIAAGAERGRLMAGATMLARDLANTPPAHLTAPKLAEVAVEIGTASGLDVEVFDQDTLIDLGCGGLLGVNGGSADEARMVRITYRPRKPRKRTPRLAIVAKGIMYDSGGISLKPSDAVHATMKNDMSGAAATLAAMSILGALGCRTEVTGYLMCTDNVPSGTALKLGDVLTIHGGRTVEVINTDAEGRLVMADGLVMAARARPDAIVDIATLTGAAMRALGTWIAGIVGSNEDLVDQIRAASALTDEQTWPLPLERRYRRELDTEVADIKNMGGPNAGTITAALFLEEFVDGLPFAHIDIAGTAQADPVESWRVKGCTGFGARLLTEFALAFRPPRG
jgi:leucyl aminopeptidase